MRQCYDTPNCEEITVNIHWLGTTTLQTAFDIDNRRLTALNKEALQLVNNAYIEWGWPKFWFPTHENHPCSRWACLDIKNVSSLLRYAYDLLAEREKANYETTETALVIEVAMQTYREATNRYFGPNDFTEPVNCARHAGLGLDYTDVPDIISAYRHYMVQRWLIDLKGGFKPRWRDAHVPFWIETINKPLFDWLILRRYDPLLHPTAGIGQLPHELFFCPLKGQPVPPPRRLNTQPVYARLQVPTQPPNTPT